MRKKRKQKDERLIPKLDTVMFIYLYIFCLVQTFPFYIANIKATSFDTNYSPVDNHLYKSVAD